MTNLTANQEKQVNNLIAAALKTIIEQVDNLKVANKNLKNELAEYKQLVTNQTQKIHELELKGLSSSTVNPHPVPRRLFNSLFNDTDANIKAKPTLDDQEKDLLNAVAIEQKEITSKEKNLLVFGLEKSSDGDDTVLINELFNSIGAETKSVKRVVRFRNAKDNKPPAVLVELKDKNDKFAILKNAKKLKSSKKFNGVFINLDLTEAQRSLFNKLKLRRDDLNNRLKDTDTFYYAIRNNKLVEISKMSVPKLNHDSKSNQQTA